MSSPRFAYLRRVVIENFRSIRKLELDLPTFAVLVGSNGSGKTNFVLALSLLGELLRRGSTEPAEEMGWDEIVRRTRKKAHHVRLGATIVLPRPAPGSQAPPGGGRPEVEVEVDLKRGAAGSVQVIREQLLLRWGEDSFAITVEDEAVRISPPRSAALLDMLVPGELRRLMAIRMQPRQVPAQTPDLTDEQKSEFAVSLILSGDPERRFFRLLSRLRFVSEAYTQAVSACSVSRVRLDATALRADAPAQGPFGEAGQGLAAAVAAQRGFAEKPKAGFEPVLTSLREIFPNVDDVVPVRIGPGRLGLNFVERGITDPFGQASVSDGVIHALALLIALARPWGRSALQSPGLLAIEEPENAIHPWSIAVLMKRMQEQRERQILLTTHSVEVVNQVRDPGALLVCDVGEGGTRIELALGKQAALRSILKQSGQRLGEVWQSGELGGVPGAEP